MKNFMALVLSFFILSTQVQAGTNGSLKLAFDELNFALTVEWDQKDKAFYRKQVSEFQSKINVLRAEGLTNQELLDFLVANIHDKAAANDLKQIYEMASAQKLSPEEIEGMTRELVNRHYARGADWIGTVLLIGAGAIVLVIGITALMLWDASNNPDNCSYDYVCQPDGTGCTWTNYHCD